MFALSNQAGGQAFAIPDVCKTPSPGGPVPIPYPNIVMTETANVSTCSKKVFFVGMNAFNLKTKWPQSMGDEAGTAGGVVSGLNMGEVGFTMGSISVKIEGSPAVFMTSQTKHNGSNPNVPCGAVLQAPQMIVNIMK